MAHQGGLCCGLYRGTIYMRDLGVVNSPLLSIGNAEVTINQTMASSTVPNFQSLGGNACQIDYPESVTMDFVLHCTSPDNLARAFLGEAFQKSGSAVIDESHVVNSDEELIAFENAPDKTSIIVKDELGNPYEVNKDYIVTNAGILTIEGTSIPMGSTIFIDYQYGNNWVVEAQTVAQKTFEVVLDGANYGEDGTRAVVLKAWRVRLAPTDSFTLIATDFANLNISGEILRDDSRPTGSKFFSVEFGSQVESAY